MTYVDVCSLSWSVCWNGGVRLIGAPGVDARFFGGAVVDDWPRSLDEKSEAIGITPSCELVTPVVVTTLADGCVVVVREIVGSNIEYEYENLLKVAWQRINRFFSILFFIIK